MREKLIHFLKQTPLAAILQDFDTRRAISIGKKAGSFSQHAEDVFFMEYFGTKPGTYVDVGANHPVKISNTYLLYRNGWKGLTVEPIARLASLHRKFRPRDTLLEVLIGPKGTMKFYQMHGTGLSTVMADRGQEAIDRGAVDKIVELPVVPLSEIIQEHLGETQVQLLSVDTEGFDLSVLQSNDWTRFRPQLVVFELSPDETFASSPAAQFLASVQYRLIRQIGCNAIMESQ